MSKLPGQRGLALPEPTVGGSYGYGLETLKKYFLEVLLITLVVFVLVSPFYIAKEAADNWDSGFALIIELFALGFWLLILGPVEWGANVAMLKPVRGEKLEFLEIFAFQKNYLNVVLAHLLVTVIIGIGFLFLIVPGIIFACRLAFVSYLVIDRKMEATEAIRESWRMTGGHSMTIFLMALLAFPLVIAGLLLLGVGIIIAVMWIDLAFAAIYSAVAAKYIPAEKTISPQG
jgi:hypothetical protein